MVCAIKKLHVCAALCFALAGAAVLYNMEEFPVRSTLSFKKQAMKAARPCIVCQWFIEHSEEHNIHELISPLTIQSDTNEQLMLDAATLQRR